MASSRIRPAHPFLRQPGPPGMAKRVRMCDPRRAPYEGWPRIYIPQEEAFLVVNFGVAYLVEQVYRAYEAGDYSGVYDSLVYMCLRKTATQFRENLAIAGLMSLTESE